MTICQAIAYIAHTDSIRNTKRYRRGLVKLPALYALAAALENTPVKENTIIHK